jgi:hypothetical protein
MAQKDIELKGTREYDFSQALPYLIGGLSIVVFIGLGFYYAQHMYVALDEGLYLLKGQWFLQGVYRPFQAYGPVTNKMPFSFWIPGLSQVLFAPGIRSGRYFCIFLGVVMMIGLWLAVRRVASLWWAAFALACVGFNPNWIQYYVRPFAQVVTALLLAWSLYFVLGKERKTWELITGTILAVLVVLTRQNLLPYLGILGIYILWEYGWRKGLAVLAGPAVLFIAFHILYWPGIYTAIWRGFVPGFINRALGFGSLNIGKSPGLQGSNYGALEKMFVVGGAIRYSFVPIVATVLVLLAYPFWKKRFHPLFKTVVFLLSSYLVLTAIHLLYAADTTVVLFSVPAYPSFYNPIGLVLLPAAFVFLKRDLGPLATALSALTVLLISAIIGLHVYREISPVLLNLQIPRVRGMRILPGSTDLWRSVYNKFHIEYANQELLMPTLSGLLVGVLVLIAAFVIWRLLRKRRPEASYGWILLLVFFTAGVVLTPTPVLAMRGATELCAQDVIAAHEAVGEQLRAEIPAGSLVFWDSDLSPILLSYIPQVRTFPPQLNHMFYYRVGGDPDAVYRNNNWNDALAHRWIAEADYILLSEESAKTWEPILFSDYAGQFDQLDPTSNALPCVDRTFLRVYKRIK